MSDESAAIAAAKARLVEHLDAEIRKGLPREQDRRTVHIMARDYYRLDGAKYIPRRPAETDEAYDKRLKLALPFVRRVVNVLTSRLYAKAPNRDVGDKTATQWLEKCYEDESVDAILQKADRLAHLHGFGAIQVAATGDRDKPLAFNLWEGWSECIPYELPGRANVVAAVVTIEAYNKQTRYTLWTDTERRVYLTDAISDNQTAGGRMSRFVAEDSGPHGYGCLPFAFVWLELPTGGVGEQQGLGEFLSKVNGAIDEQASDMSQSVKVYHAPTLTAYNVAEDWNPVFEPGKAVRVVGMDPGGLEKAPDPRLEFLQPQLDIVGGWANITQIIQNELDGMGVPLAAYRMDQSSLASGASLMAEQKPLTDYAEARQELAARWEKELAYISLSVAGLYYGIGALTAAMGLRKLSLTWPRVDTSVTSEERDARDKAAIELGIESRVMIVMRRFGLSRDQAIKHLKRAIDDEAKIAAMMEPIEPEPTSEPPTPEPEPEGDEE